MGIIDPRPQEITITRMLSDGKPHQETFTIYPDPRSCPPAYRLQNELLHALHNLQAQSAALSQRVAQIAVVLDKLAPTQEEIDASWPPHAAAAIDGMREIAQSIVQSIAAQQAAIARAANASSVLDDVMAGAASSPGASPHAIDGGATDDGLAD